MKKEELVKKLRAYARTGGKRNGQDILSEFLAYYFDRLDIPSSDKYDFFRIENSLANLLVGAIEAFRTSQDEIVIGLRNQYDSIRGMEFTSLGNDRILETAMNASALADLIGDVTDQYVKQEVEALFNAERLLLNQQFQRFAHAVHANGLYDIINESRARGMSGKFGKTTLRSYVMAGRLMYTFARTHITQEVSFTYVCEDEDPLAMSAGIQSCYADLKTCLAMLSDVIRTWPKDPAGQRRVFAADSKVRIL